MFEASNTTGVSRDTYFMYMYRIKHISNSLGYRSPDLNSNRWNPSMLQWMSETRGPNFMVLRSHEAGSNMSNWNLKRVRRFTDSVFLPNARMPFCHRVSGGKTLSWWFKATLKASSCSSLYSSWPKKSSQRWAAEEPKSDRAERCHILVGSAQPIWNVWTVHGLVKVWSYQPNLICQSAVLGSFQHVKHTHLKHTLTLVCS